VPKLLLVAAALIVVSTSCSPLDLTYGSRGAPSGGDSRPIEVRKLEVIDRPVNAKTPIGYFVSPYSCIVSCKKLDSAVMGKIEPLLHSLLVRMYPHASIVEAQDAIKTHTWSKTFFAVNVQLRNGDMADRASVSLEIEVLEHASYTSVVRSRRIAAGRDLQDSVALDAALDVAWTELSSKVEPLLH
jgi:hypothetical protein